MRALDVVRRDEHTGDDRCWRCTGVNLMLTVAAATLAYTAGSTFASDLWGGVSAGAVLATGVAAIWLRGYLVPYTPTLTRRLLPSTALSWFGKSREEDVSEVERVLVDAGVLRRTSGDSDPTLDPGFGREWMEEAEELDAEVGHGDVLEALGFDVEREDVRTFEGRGETPDAFAVEVVDRGASLARWPSRTALRVDLASVSLLADRVEGWNEKPPEWRARVARGLRLFLETCPDGGDVVRGTEEVPSCCSRGEVVTLSCQDSGERLLEQKVRRGWL